MDRFVKSSEVGETANLQTSDKTNVVAATNEVKNDVANLQTDNIAVSIYTNSNFATP